jgi:hypothetical protein
MSRGPGRIERAIEALFASQPGRTFSTEELVEAAYRGVNRTEKKHRVAVLRAAKRLGHPHPTTPPAGDKVGQHPWQAIGMSRSAWYRHGKPTAKPERMTQKRVAKEIVGISERSYQRLTRAGRLVGRDEMHKIEDRGITTYAAMEREAIYVNIQKWIDAAASEDDKEYGKAVMRAVRYKHNEHKCKDEQLKRIWRKANDDERQNFICWLEGGCDDDD